MKQYSGFPTPPSGISQRPPGVPPNRDGGKPGGFTVPSEKPLKLMGYRDAKRARQMGNRRESGSVYFIET